MCMKFIFSWRSCRLVYFQIDEHHGGINPKIATDVGNWIPSDRKYNRKTKTIMLHRQLHFMISLILKPLVSCSKNISQRFVVWRAPSSLLVNKQKYGLEHSVVFVCIKLTISLQIPFFLILSLTPDYSPIMKCKTEAVLWKYVTQVWLGSIARFLYMWLYLTRSGCSLNQLDECYVCKFPAC